MEILSVIYLVYMFISVYMLVLFFMIYIKNRKVFFDYPETDKKYTVSFIVPAYNEEKSIAETINSIFEIGYLYLLEVIVVNDCSTDNTKEIIKKLLKKYPKLKLINNLKNLGNAACSQNVGLKIAKGELVAVVDGDSFPEKESINKMAGYFDDFKVGAVTCPVLAKNKETFWEKLQAIEYQVISFGRKLLEYIDAIYVTPGPLALYRKKALDDIGGFDENNLTQDIEATWHLAAKKWDRKMCLSTSVSSIVPSKLKPWFIQRRRWNIGGLQCIYKYKNDIGKKGMLGLFIIPFFVINLFLGLLGLSIFFYLSITRIISNFLLTRYSIIAGTPILTMESFYITLNVLNYLGIILFIFGLIYVLLILSILKEKNFKKENVLNIPFYLIVYLMIYPFILVDSLWSLAKGKRKWR